MHKYREEDRGVIFRFFFVRMSAKKMIVHHRTRRRSKKRIILTSSVPIERKKKKKRKQSLSLLRFFLIVLLSFLLLIVYWFISISCSCFALSSKGLSSCCCRFVIHLLNTIFDSSANARRSMPDISMLVLFSLSHLSLIFRSWGKTK
jgi:hypothetical protein